MKVRWALVHPFPAHFAIALSQALDSTLPRLLYKLEVCDCMARHYPRTTTHALLPTLASVGAADGP